MIRRHVHNLLSTEDASMIRTCICCVHYSLVACSTVYRRAIRLCLHRLQVQIQRVAFMKDVAFYLACLLLVMAMTADGKVVLWETAVMGLVYVTYVFTTFWVSRHDEPVHADVAHHEVPLEEGVGELQLLLMCVLCSANSAGNSQWDLPACSYSWGRSAAHAGRYAGWDTDT